eukprot:10061794-Lingulodinium_polyedra.AAC.1
MVAIQSFLDDLARSGAELAFGHRRFAFRVRRLRVFATLRLPRAAMGLKRVHLGAFARGPIV